MYKKIISLALVCAMLVCVSPAVAAEDSVPKPTIQEILNDYYLQSLELDFTSNDNGVTTYSGQRSGDSQSLVQDTVSKLRDAGYEAYNVTSSNYESLEESLQTDFEQLGLDPNGSYIITISGENDSTGTNPNSRVIDLPSYEDFGDPSSSFQYTEEGVTYTMRYVTVASTDNSILRVNTTHVVTDTVGSSALAADILSTAVSIVVDDVTQFPLSSIASLLADWISPSNVTELDPDSIIIFAATQWTRSYIQVYHADGNRWYTCQCSEYAYTQSYCDAGYVYNSKSGKYEPTIGEEITNTKYSAFYNDPATRKARAVLGFNKNITYHDCTGDIEFYLSDPHGNIDLGGESVLLFKHVNSQLDHLPPWQAG